MTFVIGELACPSSYRLIFAGDQPSALATLPPVRALEDPGSSAASRRRRIVMLREAVTSTSLVIQGLSNSSRRLPCPR
jgi:hypothetical protein